MGLEDIMMIVNINPSRDMFDESQHVLNFSAIAKEILVEEQPRVIKPKKVNRFSQYMDSKTTSIQPIQEVEEDEKDIEIYNLKVIISKLYTEIENKKREYDVELKLEREHIISCYKEINEGLERKFEEYKVIALNKRREYEDKIRELKNYYTALLNDQEVISLDSSSEDEDSSSGRSLEKDIRNLDAVVAEQATQISHLQQELYKVQAERDQLEKDIRILPELKEEIKILTEKNTNLKLMLKDAIEVCTELKQELQEEQRKTKRLVSENLQMKEDLELFGEQV